MNDLILPSSIQQAIMNWLAGVTGPFENSTMHLFSASTLPLDNQSTLGQFTECTFDGYAPITGQSPIGVYIDPTFGWHAKFDSQEWDVANGAQQAGTVTVVGAVTMSGTLDVVVTAAGMTGSPRTVVVNVLNGDTAAQAAAKIAAALNLDADVATFFTATANGAVVTLQRLLPVAEDGTMNMSLALGTATGPAPVATWTQTVAGQVPFSVDQSALGIYVTDAGGTQYRGAALFPAPVSVARPYQAVLAWPDIPYGA